MLLALLDSLLKVAELEGSLLGAGRILSQFFISFICLGAEVDISEVEVGIDGSTFRDWSVGQVFIEFFQDEVIVFDEICLLMYEINLLFLKLFLLEGDFFIELGGIPCLSIELFNNSLKVIGKLLV